MSVTIGVDVGDRYSRYCCVDGQGQLVQEGRVRTTPEALGGQFGGVQRCRVVLETGTHSPWESRVLGADLPEHRPQDRAVHETVERADDHVADRGTGILSGDHRRHSLWELRRRKTHR